MFDFKHYINMGTVGSGSYRFRRFVVDNTPRITEVIDTFSTVTANVLPISIIPEQTETIDTFSTVTANVLPISIIPEQTETIDTFSEVTASVGIEVNP